LVKEEQLLKELQSIKRLLILLLIKSGATSEEIGRAVGIDSSVIRRMFPMKKTKKVGGD
jgi:NADH/NAD ratio-sensing transcriptional regulator Rex